MSAEQAQSRIYDLLNCKAETLKLITEVGALLEDCIPDASVWVLKTSPTSGETQCVFSSIRHGSSVSGPANTTSTCTSPPHLPGSFAPAMRILDIDSHQEGSNIRALFPANEFSSIITHRIRPSNHHAWGHIFVLFALRDQTLEQRTEILSQANLWIQFAVTILERRILEERLQTVETRLDLATKSGGIGIFDWDIVNETLYWSPQQYEIHGVTPETFTPSHQAWAGTLLPEDIGVVENALKKAFTSHERYYRANYRSHHPNGETRWIESLGEAIYNGEATPIRLIGTARDCTEQVKAREQIALDRRRLQLALEAGELGFWDWNITTGEVQFGGQWMSMLGYELNEIEPHVRAWEKLVHPDDMPLVREVLEKHLQGLSPLYETEHRLRAKDGSWIWVLDRGRVIEKDDTGKPSRAIGIHADITLQREIRDRLREADRRKDEFLATLAHELRNPLAPIRTGLAIMKRDPNSPAASQAREIMERQLTLMVRLIDDLLDVSRITLGRLQLKKEDISIRSIVDMAVESSKPAIDAAHHTLTCSLPPDDTIINCDPTRLSQIISNLLTNAAKYTPNNGAIMLTVSIGNTSIDISVRDNGLGIPEGMQGRVFELFGQVNRTLDRSQGGLGIGLALVRNLVALHGGTVSVSSPGIGKGSTFTISLPLSMIKEPPLELATETAAHPPAPHRRVLIVDDNVDAANSLSMLAQLLGHTAEVAFTGKEALDKAPYFQPDVVFLDIGLPGMSGLEVARLMKMAPSQPTPYIVALTGWGTEETKQKAREAGFDEHLTKPVEIARVEKILAYPTYGGRSINGE
jgi:PAS domain S-box-containing protein